MFLLILLSVIFSHQLLIGDWVTTSLLKTPELFWVL